MSDLTNGEDFNHAVCFNPGLARQLELSVAKVGARGGGIYRYDDKAEHLYLLAYQGQVAALFVPLNKGETVIGTLVEEERSFLNIKNYAESPVKARHWHKDLYRSLLVVKLTNKGRCVGVLFLEHDQTNRFLDDHVQELSQERDLMEQEIAALAASGALERLDTYEGIIDRSPFATIAVERGKVKAFNRAAARLYGWHPTKMLGTDVNLFYEGGELEAKLVGKKLKANWFIEHDTRTRHGSGTLFPVKISIYRTGSHSSVGIVEDMREFGKVANRRDFLLACSEVFSTAKSSKQVQHNIVKLVVEKLGATVCRIYQRNREGNGFRLSQSKPDLIHKKKGKTAPFWIPLSFLNKVDNFLCIIKDQAEPETFNYFTSLFSLEIKTKMLVVQPLWVKGEITGFLLATSSDENTFLDSEASQKILFNSLGTQMRGCLSRLELQEEKRQSEKWLRSFYEKGEPLSSQESVKTTLEKASQKIKSAFLNAHCFVLVCNTKGEIPSITEESVGVGRLIESSVLDVAREVLNARKLQVLIKDENHIQGDIQEVSSSDGRPCRTYLGIPLLLWKKPIGVVVVYFERVYHFSALESRTIEAYARQVALVIDDSRKRENQDHFIESMKIIDELNTTEQILSQTHSTLARNAEQELFYVGMYDIGRNQFVDEVTRLQMLPSERDRVIKKVGSAWQSVGRQFTRKTLLLSRIDQDLILLYRIQEPIIGFLYIPQGGDIEISGWNEAALGNFLGHVGFAIKRVRSLESLGMVLDVAIKVTEATTGVTLEDSLNKIADIVCQALSCEHVVLTVTNSDEATIYESHNFGDQSWQLDKHHQLPRGFSTRVRAGSAHNTLDAVNWHGVFDLNNRAIRPLKFKEESVGSLITLFHELVSIDETLQRRLDLVADLIAGAVGNALARDKSFRRFKAAQSVYEYVEPVESLAMPDILTSLLAQGTSLLKLWGGNSWFVVELWLAEEQGIRRAAYSQAVYVSKYSVIPPKGIEGRRGIVGICFETGKVQVIQNTSDHPDYINSYAQTKSELVVPIKAGNEIFGFLNMESERADFFDPQLVMTTEALASHASIMIQSSKLHQKLQKLGGLIGEQSVDDWVNMMSATWGHDIYRGVGSARGKLARLQGRIDMDNPELADLVRKMDHALTQVGEIPKHFPAGTEIVDMNGLAADTLSRIWKRNHFDEVRLEVLPVEPVEAIWVKTSPYWIERLLMVLAENAVRAMAATAPGAKTFRVSIQRLKQKCQVSFLNSGPGISPQLRAILLKRQITTEEGRHGQGIGLMLARSIASAFGGDLCLSDQVTQGVEFILTLPIYTEDQNERM